MGHGAKCMEQKGDRARSVASIGTSVAEPVEATLYFSGMRKYLRGKL